MAGIAVNLNGMPQGARRHRVLVVVEPHEQRLGYRGRDSVEAVERRRRHPHQRGLLVLEHVSDGTITKLGMAMGAGVFQATIEQPGVQLVVAGEAQQGREKAFAHHADLVLDLTLLPSRCRRARGRLDQVMVAHLQEAAVELAFLAQEHCVHRGGHVVVNPARADAAEEGERPCMGVEHHLLRLAGVGTHEQHPAMAQPQMRDLHRRRHAGQHHDLMAPVELVSCGATIRVRTARQ